MMITQSITLSMILFVVEFSDCRVVAEKYYSSLLELGTDKKDGANLAMRSRVDGEASDDL